MSKHKIFGFGEILWDLLPQGKQLGGAPANFIYHCTQLGADAISISSIGNDPLGYEIKEVLSNNKVEAELSISDLPTGTVSVELDDQGIPSYIIHENVAWDDIQLSNQTIDQFRQADALCFGTLSQRSANNRKVLSKLLSIVPSTCLRVFDINIRQSYYSKDLIEECLTSASIFKLNEDELELMKSLFSLRGTTEEILSQLIKNYHLNVVALTMGTEGSYLCTENETSFLPTPKVNVVDTVGAGDAFTAALVVGWLQSKTLKQIHEEAVELSAFVCTRSGAMVRMI
ncbi:carbohydrate kinase [Flammeovirga yaeyamensis]|uniref:Carbohydrate kinase n=1 Tax=Flammeovirga yaeyamensis TaxID=367791 RepID=A0AAX1NBZ3_9BACT|nr:carbohydrate kinase [Flammeovirga yaeyamensis]MBB3697030.1 fructokinase [Flammeovirga yaeyamensis]NMF33693.1 carbohydrate kinase [Flammeovirga yaeyamensis]QWG05041.1 carbohydrate kinase [Flammeovirga yaeyamensis]